MIFASPSRVIGGTSLGNLYVRLTMDPSDLITGTTGATKALTGFEAALNKVAFASTAAFAVIGALGINEYRKFNQAMTESLSIMGNISQQMKDDLEETAITISTKSVFAADELARSYYYIVSSGQSAAQAIKLIKPISDFATAGLMNLTQATQFLTNSQIALGLKVQDPIKNMQNLTLVSDMLTKASIISDATIQQFAEALQNRFAGAMRAYNISLSQGISLLADFANQGIKGQRAGYAAFMTIRNLMDAAAKNGQIFKEFGVNVFDATGKLQPLSNILAQLTKAFSSASDEEKAQALQLMGIQQRSQSYLITLLNTTDSLDELNSQLQRVGGTTKQVADVQMQSFNNQWKEALHQLQAVAIEIGKNLAPAVLSLIHDISRAAQGLLQWQKDTGGLTAIIQSAEDGVKYLSLGFVTLGNVGAIVVNTIVSAFKSLVIMIETVGKEFEALFEYIKHHPLTLGDIATGKFGSSNVLGLAAELGKVKAQMMSELQNNSSVSVGTNQELLKQIATSYHNLFPQGASINNLMGVPNPTMPSAIKAAPPMSIGTMSPLMGFEGGGSSLFFAPNSPFLSPQSPFISPQSPFINPSSPFINPASPLINSTKSVSAGQDTVKPVIDTMSLQKFLLGSLKEMTQSYRGSGAFVAPKGTATAQEQIQTYLTAYQGQTDQMYNPASKQTSQFEKYQNDIAKTEEWIKSLQSQEQKYGDAHKEIMDKVVQATQEAQKRIQSIYLAEGMLTAQAAQNMFTAWANAIQGFAGKQNVAYEAMFASSKVFAIAEASVNMGLALSKAFSSGSNVFEMFTNLAAAGTQMATIISDISSVTLNLSGKATGGPVYAGQPVWVGEKGAEIFTPTQDGTIIPNNMIRQGSGMGGSQTTVNVHNYSGGKASVQESQDENGKVINVIVERAKNSIASDILQGTGKVNHAISQSYGLRRGTRI